MVCPLPYGGTQEQLRGNSYAADESEHRYTFTVWFITHNATQLIDRGGPHYPLRVMYFPSKLESL